MQLCIPTFDLFLHGLVNLYAFPFEFIQKLGDNKLPGPSEGYLGLVIFKQDGLCRNSTGGVVIKQ